MARWTAQGKYPGIFRDQDDPTHWRVVVNLGRAGRGEPRRRAVKVLHGTLTDARAAKTELQGQRDKREIMPQATQAPRTLDDWFAAWLETYKRRGLTRASHARYRDSYALWIAPHIGTAKLRDLSAMEAQTWANSLMDSGLSPGTIYMAVALLRQCVRAGIAKGMLSRDPTEGLSLPKRPGRRPLRVPSDDELRALLDSMSAADASAYPITRFALATGMRMGELIALEWSSVDLADGTVYVCRSASRVPSGPDEPRTYAPEFKETKTPASTNRIELDAQTVAFLKEHRKMIAAAKLALRPRRWTDKDGDLVFPCTSVFAGSLAGRAWQPGSLRKAFKAYAEPVGLGYLRFHDTRHLYGALLYRNGVPLLTISRLMRHKNIKTTADTYGHVGDEQRREAVDTLAAVWGADGASGR